jgi:hypothetical protein
MSAVCVCVCVFVCVCVCVRDFREGEQVWVCVDQHECSSSIAPMDGWFCWVRKLVKTILFDSFFICSKCAVELTEGACAGDRREDRSAEGACSRSVRAMGAQRAPQVVQGGPVNLILRCPISGC